VTAKSPERPVSNTALAEELQVGAVLRDAEGHATTLAAVIREAAGASDLNEGSLGDGRDETKRNLLRLARSSFNSVEVFEDCSGGNSRLSYPLGCGGRSFFDQEVDHRCGWVSGCGEKSRPSRFFRFQVPDPFLFSFFVGLCCVSDTEG
jgi:hypothetical protein